MGSMPIVAAPASFVVVAPKPRWNTPSNSAADNTMHVSGAAHSHTTLASSANQLLHSFSQPQPLVPGPHDDATRNENKQHDCPNALDNPSGGTGTSIVLRGGLRRGGGGGGKVCDLGCCRLRVSMLLAKGKGPMRMAWRWMNVHLTDCHRCSAG
jgi:hypothetical protein